MFLISFNWHIKNSIFSYLLFFFIFDNFDKNAYVSDIYNIIQAMEDFTRQNSL